MQLFSETFSIHRLYINLERKLCYEIFQWVTKNNVDINILLKKCLYSPWPNYYRRTFMTFIGYCKQNTKKKTT